MGCMSNMAVVLQERGTAYPWRHMGCMSDMAVVLQERGTVYPWRAHGLYEWHGSCLTRERNCLPLTATWAVWVTWQLSYKKEELFTLGGHMGCMSDMAVVLQERGTVYPCREHGLYEWHDSCLTAERNSFPLAGTWAVWVTWQLSYKKEELFTLAGNMGCMSDMAVVLQEGELLTLGGHMGCMSYMAVVLQERGTAYPWQPHGLYEWHGSCLTRKRNCVPLSGTWAVWVTWQLSYKREELLTLGGHIGCMSDMAVVLQERGTVYPWREHGLYEWHGSCLTRERNCLPLAGTWAVWVTWQLSYKREELFTLGGQMGCMSDMAVVLQESGIVYPWRHMGWMSDVAVVLQERGTVYPWRAHGLYEWYGSCLTRGTAYPWRAHGLYKWHGSSLTRERNCLPLAGTWAIWVTWQLSYKKGELFTLGGHMGCMSGMAVVLQERGTAYPWRAHGLYEWHGSCLTREGNCLPLAGTLAVWVTWQLSYKRGELLTLGGHMGCMSDMAVVLQARGTVYPWRAHWLYEWHGSCLTREGKCLPLPGTLAVWVTWQLSYKRGELFTLGGHMGCMSDMAVVLQERGTVYPWRAHGLYEWHGSCLTRERNCLPLAGTWAIWVTWQLSYKREELFTLGGHNGSSRVFYEDRVVRRFSFLYCVFIAFFAFVLCLVYPLLQISLD